VTLIELIVFVAMIALGFLLGRAMYHLGGLWLGTAGFVVGVALVPSAFFVYLKCRHWAYRGDAVMPDCSCGGSAFRVQKVGDEYHLLCQQCKTRYEKNDSEVWVVENGVRRPYKRLVKWQGWV
jgi:hypothetical protein